MWVYIEYFIPDQLWASLTNSIINVLQKNAQHNHFNFGPHIHDPLRGQTIFLQMSHGLCNKPGGYLPSCTQHNMIL